MYIEEIRENTRTITGVATSITSFVGSAKRGPFNKPVTIHSFEQYETTFGGLYKSSAMSYAVYHYFINGGLDAIIVRAISTRKNAVKQVLGNRVKKTGIYALDKIKIFNILCIPGFTSTGDTPKSVYDAALEYCKERKAILLIDPPSSWVSMEEANIDNDSNMPHRSENGAIFFPRILTADPKQDDLIRDFPPCGAVAGVIARSDSRRGVWNAPAGLDATLTGTIGLTINLTDDEQGVLNPKAINCLRVFPQTGPVIWGSRTMVGADELGSQWKYLPIRRTALFIEESLYRGTQWVVFEPNDEPLWSQIKLNVSAFMQDLFRRGAFQGSTPKEAYFVKCDKETMTSDDINRGTVNILVGFAPLKPAEFIVIKIQQKVQKPK